MTVHFIVPTLGDRPDYLSRAIASVLGQDVDGLDLVLVAPPGRGVEAVAEATGCRFVPDPGQGISAALNAGLAAAAPGTAYVGWLGDDDLLTPGSLRLTVAALDGNPAATLAYGWCDYIDAADRVVFRSRAGRIASAILRFGPNLVPQPGSLMRYDTVVDVGGVDDSVRLALDLDLFLRLRRRGPFVALPHVLALFRWHDDSSTVANGRESMEESDQVRMRYMSPTGRRVYRYARWPGRWALSAAKHVASRNARKP